MSLLTHSLKFCNLLNKYIWLIWWILYNFQANHLLINMLVSFRIVTTMAKQYIFDKITILASMLSITDNCLVNAKGYFLPLDSVAFKTFTFTPKHIQRWSWIAHLSQLNKNTGFIHEWQKKSAEINMLRGSIINVKQTWNCKKKCEFIKWVP